MAQVLIRNLDEKVVTRLKRRAAQKGRSLQVEVKMILEDAAKEADQADLWREISRFREKLRRSGRTFSDSAKLIREDRDR
jgi:plasmid stability protein